MERNPRTDVGGPDHRETVPATTSTLIKNCGTCGSKGGTDGCFSCRYDPRALAFSGWRPKRPPCKWVFGCVDHNTCSSTCLGLDPLDRKGLPAARKPKLLIIGHARHGKDTVAELLRDNHGYSFASSSMWAGAKAVRPALAACGVTYGSLEECYADRVNWRGFWYEAISAYNRGGASRLAQEILVDHDCYVGMRSNREFIASRPLFDVVAWVDASERKPAEDAKSMDIPYDPATMARIDNNRTLGHLMYEVDQFASTLCAPTIH